MALIKKFEDIVAWQEARTLTKEIYKISGIGAFGQDYGLRDQIRRATVSVMSNIAEGFDCESNKEFGRFLEIARRSTLEIQSLLYVAQDVTYISQEQFEEFYQYAEKTRRFIGGLRYSILKNSFA